VKLKPRIDLPASPMRIAWAANPDLPFRIIKRDGMETQRGGADDGDLHFGLLGWLQVRPLLTAYQPCVIKSWWRKSAAE
jgi:hypothetical protein